MNNYASNTFFSLPKALKEASLVLFTLTFLYSTTISYACYIPKESIEESIKRDFEELKFLKENIKK